MHQGAEVAHVRLGDGVGIAVGVGQAEAVQTPVDLVLVDPRVLAHTDRRTGRDPSKREEDRGHEQEEKDPDRHSANEVEGHVFILRHHFALSEAFRPNTARTPG